MGPLDQSGPYSEKMRGQASPSFLAGPEPAETRRKGEKQEKLKLILINTPFLNYLSNTFACPDLGIKFLYQFFALNPNLRSKMQNSELQRRKNEINNNYSPM